MRKTFVIAFFVLSCFLCAHAQEGVLAHQADSVMAAVGHGRLDSMQYIQNVIIYGRRPYEDVIPAQELTGKQLEGLNSHSVADAVRYFAGVQLKDYGGVGGLKTVDIRSMGTNHMGVFYDGIQIGNAQNGQVDLGKFSLDNIEAISLYNGQRSNIFQSAKDYGSAGTIYLRTRRPKFKEGKRDNLNVSFKTGSFGLVNPSVRWEHKLSRSVSLSFNSEFTYATGKYRFRYMRHYSDGSVAWDTTAVRQNGDVRSYCDAQRQVARQGLLLRQQQGHSRCHRQQRVETRTAAMGQQLLPAGGLSAQVHRPLRDDVQCQVLA